MFSTHEGQQLDFRTSNISLVYPKASRDRKPVDIVLTLCSRKGTTIAITETSDIIIKRKDVRISDRIEIGEPVLLSRRRDIEYFDCSIGSKHFSVPTMVIGTVEEIK